MVTLVLLILLLRAVGNMISFLQFFISTHIDLDPRNCANACHMNAFIAFKKIMKLLMCNCVFTANKSCSFEAVGTY